MLSLPRRILFIATLLALCGCQTLASEDVAARITDPTTASRAALSAAVNAAFGTEVMLDDDALTTSSILTIEHNPPGSINDAHALGRTLARPVQFRLLLDGGDCVLVRQGEGSRFILMDTTCLAE